MEEAEALAGSSLIDGAAGGDTVLHFEEVHGRPGASLVVLDADSSIMVKRAAAVIRATKRMMEKCSPTVDIS